MDLSSGVGAPFSFGKVLRNAFLFEEGWVNLNHGSFGGIPLSLKYALRRYQEQAEESPDRFVRYEFLPLLEASRKAVAELVHAPPECVIFVGNATEGVNTVFRNLVWAADGKDVILTFSTVYEACGKVADYMVDYFAGLVEHREIPITYPLEDEDILRAFRDTVKKVKADGKRAHICLFDVVSSRPGVLFPWLEMIKACKELGVISMVDGAQGIGMVPLDLIAADPDFFVSNCHKWLYAPRGCAIFYVPLRNQHLLPTTLATSHGYLPKWTSRQSPLPAPPTNSAFVSNFEFVGTKDNCPYLCVKDAISWRDEVLGGEEVVLKYLWTLNKKGIALVAEKLGTEVLNNSRGTMTDCAMGNVALPIWIGARGDRAKDEDAVVPAEDVVKVMQWMGRTMTYDYNTFVSLFVIRDRFWARISAQIYLDMRDYEFAADMLGKLSRRVAKRDYQDKGTATASMEALSIDSE